MSEVNNPVEVHPWSPEKILERVDNLKKLAKEKAKDAGIYTGATVIPVVTLLATLYPETLKDNPIGAALNAMTLLLGVYTSFEAVHTGIEAIQTSNEANTLQAAVAKHYLEQQG